MDRSPFGGSLRNPAEPHARGDGPCPTSTGRSAAYRAPRTWGWTDTAPEETAPESPSPTHVGMDLGGPRHHVHRQAEPHARGDGPSDATDTPRGPTRAPRTWGWTAPTFSENADTLPSPTHVGMDRPDVLGECGHAPEPHARGDGPVGQTSATYGSFSDSRTWGWTARTFALNADALPSTTHVGMDRSGRRRRRMGRPEPHARGDGPTIRSYTDTAKLRAPRTRGMKSFCDSTRSPRGASGCWFQQIFAIPQKMSEADHMVLLQRLISLQGGSR